ncbi:helix-turn-helix domain-containing protein [Gordonia sp. Z-3]|uniref:Helix-turn-helix domain-containing protein n=1 Tax=Gordonia tangerina TaxID=2911060 RepID=A0ABS9DH37_9ACTN|nr:MULTISPECIES: helix-turn-helix domain-containing protein [Gordonia]MAU80686.1 hypothetical protein [Gordonia sp. (in: high G+C Gram-positive bacteria)]MCF3938525.1 helix-turn-helix domain-containing protein [Gordonia tangerina]MED5803970.1 helix-turn-helix domain-containing protein [Gordonia sp. Z-3]
MITYLEHARTEAGLTQQQLATAAGVHRMTVASIEGGNAPKPATATSLVTALAHHGIDDVDPTSVHQGRLRSDPDAAAALYQLGRLLTYLPLRSPKDEFWTILGEHLGRAPDFLRTRLRTLHTDIYDLTDHELTAVDDLAHLLRHLPATPATAHALRGGHWFATDDIALLWLTTTTTAAWTLWLHTNPDHLPR